MAAEVIYKKKDHCLPSAEDGQFAACGIGVVLQIYIFLLVFSKQMFLRSADCKCTKTQLYHYFHPTLIYEQVQTVAITNSIRYLDGAAFKSLFQHRIRRNSFFTCFYIP